MSLPNFSNLSTESTFEIIFRNCLLTNYENWRNAVNDFCGWRLLVTSPSCYKNNLTTPAPLSIAWNPYHSQDGKFHPRSGVVHEIQWNTHLVSWIRWGYFHLLSKRTPRRRIFSSPDNAQNDIYTITLRKTISVFGIVFDSRYVIPRQIRIQKI